MTCQIWHNLPGFFQPAKSSGKKRGNGEGNAVEQQPPLAAAYKAVIEAQIVEGSPVPQAIFGSMLDRSVSAKKHA